MRRVDHQPVWLARLGHQGREDSLEHAEAPSVDEAVAEGLMRAIAARRIAPLQAIADRLDDAADNPPVVNTRQTARAREKRLDPAHLRVQQQESLGHPTPPAHRGSRYPEPRKGS